jgi:hypothetical protein
VLNDHSMECPIDHNCIRPLGCGNRQSSTYASARGKSDPVVLG